LGVSGNAWTATTAGTMYSGTWDRTNSRSELISVLVSRVEVGSLVQVDKGASPLLVDRYSPTAKAGSVNTMSRVSAAADQVMAT
jgi:hypothetical protein